MNELRRENKLDFDLCWMQLAQDELETGSCEDADVKKVKIYLRDEQASSLHEGPVPRDS
jgi:hypothetical protein